MAGAEAILKRCVPEEELSPIPALWILMMEHEAEAIQVWYLAEPGKIINPKYPPPMIIAIPEEPADTTTETRAIPEILPVPAVPGKPSRLPARKWNPAGDKIRTLSVPIPVSTGALLLPILLNPLTVLLPVPVAAWVAGEAVAEAVGALVVPVEVVAAVVGVAEAVVLPVAQDKPELTYARCKN